LIVYAGPFILLALIPAFFYAFGGAAPVASVVLLLAALIGAECLSQRGAVMPVRGHAFGFRALVYLYIPLQWGVTLWAVIVAARAGVIAFLSLSLADGVMCGVFGMLAAHELIHSRSRSERIAGGIMLGAMSYRHFRIAHLHGHHRWAATPRDAATARLGESFYAFLPRTLAGQLLEACRFEHRRCGGRLFANRIAHDAVVMPIVLAALMAVSGPGGVLFFILQSAVAVVVLEMFNYIAHYGLERERLPDGRWARLEERHSWNSSNVAANLLIFNMGRHASHHERPAATYETLEWVPSAPELPSGYAASILLALIPPLWRRVMDPKVRCYRSSDATSQSCGTTTILSALPSTR
jgi:alkane 1-monooxygenase